MLPEASQGCLALTCKTYYEQFKSVFRDRFFDLGDVGIDLSAAEGSDPDTLHTLWGRIGKDRLLFLTLAQLPQLLYCASCCLLHPSTEFDTEGLVQSKRLRSCKWPGVSLTGRRLESTVEEKDYVANLDLKLPWRYEFNNSNYGFMELRLKRDQHHSIISTLKYMFSHMHNHFVANAMACPHIALEDLFLNLDTEFLFQTFACLHCKARIVIKMTLTPSPFGNGLEKPYYYSVTVIRNLGRSTLSGKDLWWRYAQYSIRKDPTFTFLVRESNKEKSAVLPL